MAQEKMQRFTVRLLQTLARYLIPQPLPNVLCL